MQQILADAAESGGSLAQSYSLADLLGLCLVALAFASEVSISKDLAGMAAMASRLSDSLSDVILKVCGVTWLPYASTLPTSVISRITRGALQCDIQCCCCS